MPWVPGILPAMGDMTSPSQQDTEVTLRSQRGIGQRAGAEGRCIVGATTQVFSLSASRSVGLYLSTRERIQGQPESLPV